jgi:hypothetical protein
MLPWRLSSAPPAPPPPFDVSYECRHPGEGWTQVVHWSGAAGSVLAGPSADGPWAFLPIYGELAVRDGVEPSSSSVVRVLRADETESSVSTTAPSAAC